MKFLIDECLSLELVKLAWARGYGESPHVTWIGRAGWKDWSLKQLILEGDWTFVTKNSRDFRGPANRPGSKGQYAGVQLHAGLVCLNGPVGMDLDMTLDFFERALDDLVQGTDLINQVLEVALGDSGVRIIRYNLPAADETSR